MPAFQRAGKSIMVPCIFHSDGDLMPILDDLLGLGMNSLRRIEPGPMDLATVKARYGEGVCLIGKVSVDALSSRSSELVRRLVRDAITTAEPGGGYIISSSNSIPDYADPANVRTLSEAIQVYGAYPLRWA